MIRHWSAEEDIHLVMLPAVPYRKSGDTFEFNSRSEKRWFMRVFKECLREFEAKFLPLVR